MRTLPESGLKRNWLRHSDYVSDQNLKIQRSLQTIATMLATTEVNVQDIQMLGLHLEWEIEIHIQRHANRTEDEAFLAPQENASIAV